MQDWDEHIDGVLRAYNSTRHGTTGLSPYMLQHGAEKSTPLSFIYPEFAAGGFDSKEEFVEHLLARQQEIHELDRRNSHQEQLRQKLKFDSHLNAKAHAVGDAVWVFWHIIPKSGTRKLIRAWHGPHKVTDVLQDGRLYVLDTGQKIQYERLKNHVPAPLDWAAHQPFGLDQNVAIIADRYVEESQEEITSDFSQDSFQPEKLPEASFELEPTRPVPREPSKPARKLSSSKEYHDEDSAISDILPTQNQKVTEQPILDPAPQVVFPELDDLEPLFSDQVEVQPGTPAWSLIPSPSGIPNSWPWRNSHRKPITRVRPRARSQTYFLHNPIKEAGGDDHEAEPLVAETNTPLPQAEARHLLENQPEEVQELESLLGPRPEPWIELWLCLRFQRAHHWINPPHLTSSQAPRYQLRANSAPRYRCGTCGSRNCICVQLITIEHPDLRLAWGAAVPARELTRARVPEHPQHKVLTVQARRQEPITLPTIGHIILTVEKTYSSVEFGVVLPLKSTLKALYDTSPSECPNYRFK